MGPLWYIAVRVGVGFFDGEGKAVVIVDMFVRG